MSHSTDRYVVVLPHHNTWGRGPDWRAAFARAVRAAGIQAVSCEVVLYRTPKGSVNAHVTPDGTVFWQWADRAAADAHRGREAELLGRWMGQPAPRWEPPAEEPDRSWEATTEAVLRLVMGERRRQVNRYGHNSDLADGTGPATRWLLPYTTASAADVEADLRSDYEDFEEEAGAPTWVHLVREEVAEAFQESDPTRLTEELVQVAALCVSWVEKLQTRVE